MISWPAAKQIRCVKPSIATVSPSWTSAATASRIEATFEALIVDVRAAGQTASIPAIAPARGRQDLALADLGDGLAEDPQAGRHLGRR